MRRPFCILCFAALGVQLVFVFLPQVVFLPLAAFFVCGLAWLVWRGKKTLALFLLAGVLLGGSFFLRNVWQIRRLSRAYEGRSCTLSATVEAISPSYYEGVVKAQLRVTEVDTERANFRSLCVCMPSCVVGEEIVGEFTLEVPSEESFRSDYSDNILFLAELVEETEPVTVGYHRGFWVQMRKIQQRVSDFFRQELDEEKGAILAALTVGDRQWLSDETKRVYRAAGLSHVLVVSGMHVSILGSGLFVGKFRRGEITRRRRLAQAFCSVGSAVLLTGIAGGSPSLLRADTAVLISALGVVLFAPDDILTSLGAAGLWMSAKNSFALADTGFQLSFAAVLGMVLGNWLYYKSTALCKERAGGQRQQTKRKKTPQEERKERLQAILTRGMKRLLLSGCASLGISIVSFPVLLLQGSGVSLYALLSAVCILWTVKIILSFGVLAGLFCLFSPLLALARGIVWCANFPLSLLNGWAGRISSLPKAEVYSMTYYPLVVFVVVGLLCGMAYQKRVRLVLAVPTISLLLAVAIGLGILHNQNVYSVALVGSRRSPCVVVLAEGEAVVLLRGGNSNQYAVERYLERWGSPTVEMVLDMRTKPKHSQGLSAAVWHSIAEGTRYHVSRWDAKAVTVELLPTKGGSLVRLIVGGKTFALQQGTVHLGEVLPVDILLASASRPDSIRTNAILTRSKDYPWLEEKEDTTVFYGQRGLVCRFRPHGGAAVAYHT